MDTPPPPSPPPPPSDETIPEVPRSPEGGGDPEGTAPGTTEAPSDDLRPLVAHGLVIGLTPLIPVPFLDDWTRNRLRRWQVRQRLGVQNVFLGDGDVQLLAEGFGGFDPKGCFKGCALGAVTKAVFYVIKKLSFKIFRKIMIFFLIKDCVDAVADTFHEGFLLDRAARTGFFDEVPVARPDAPPSDAVQGLRKAIDQSLDMAERGPIEQLVRTVFAGSRGVLLHAARELARRLRVLRRQDVNDSTLARELAEEGEEELGGLIDTLTAEISGQAAYLETFGERFDHLLSNLSVTHE